MKIKLYDLMGVKSGMSYLEAFYKLLNENDIQTEIMSNFRHNNKKKHLPNIFVGSSFKKIVNLIGCYVKLFSSIIKLQEDEYIVVLLYGIVLDIPLFIISKLSKKVILDVHELMALDYKSPALRKLLNYFYRTCPNKIIAHSEKIIGELNKLSYKSEILFVPLFNNFIDAAYDVEKLGEDVTNAFDGHSKYLLFFGNIRPSKGISDLLAATGLLKDDNIKIIIAGQDIFDTIKEYKNTHTIGSNITLILKLINEDEMKYLFTKSHVALLPYANISQSGVLQTAVSFKIPLLTSNIDYFRSVFSEFPSFGQYTDTGNPAVFADSLMQFGKAVVREKFYTKADMEKYYQNDKFGQFIKRLKNL